jgi:hypothetical protein
MCGIAGFSLSPHSKLPVRQFAHELLLHSEERGKVAAGFAFMQGGKVYHHKDAKNGGHLPLQSMPKNARVGFIHTRNATKGDPGDNENNHPLVDSKQEITLVHNGVITNHKAIEDGLVKETQEAFPEVDSAVLPALIRENGFKGLEHADGWAAVAWFDVTAPGVLNLARTTGNAPLVIAQLRDGSFVFASTFQILHASLLRVGYGDQIRWGYEVPEHHYYQIKNGGIDVIQGFEKYLVSKAKYKTVTLTWQEKKDLEAVTNGSAVSYSDPKAKAADSAGAKTNAPAASTTTTTGAKPSGSVGAGTKSKVHQPQLYTGGQVGAGVNGHGPGYKSPYGGSGKPSYNSVPLTPVEEKPHFNIKPGEDPLAALGSAFKPNTTESKPTSTGSYSSYGGRGAGVTASGGKSGQQALPVGTTFQTPLSAAAFDFAKDAVPSEVSDMMIFWACWREKTGDFEYDFNVVDPHEGEGYLEFCETTKRMDNEGWLDDSGILDGNGELVSFNGHKTYDQDVVKIMEAHETMVKKGWNRFDLAEAAGITKDVNIHMEQLTDDQLDLVLGSINGRPIFLDGTETLGTDQDIADMVSDDPALVQAFLQAQNDAARGE